MNREIKFRAFHKEAKEMYWFDVMNGNHSQGNGYIGMALFGEPITKERYRDRMILVDPMECEIMQFSGLKDRNELDIYEGDIIMYYNKYSEKTYKGIVRFCNKFACFGIFKDINTEWLDECDWIKIQNEEVIGNIYQNPELL